MRKSPKEPCTLCPALTERNTKPYCIFFEDEVIPAEDGCRHQFINKSEVYNKLLTVRDARR